jgi:hypothetical protein
MCLIDWWMDSHVFGIPYHISFFAPASSVSEYLLNVLSKYCTLAAGGSVRWVLNSTELFLPSPSNQDQSSSKLFYPVCAEKKPFKIFLLLFANILKPEWRCADTGGTHKPRTVNIVLFTPKWVQSKSLVIFILGCHYTHPSALSTRCAVWLQSSWATLLLCARTCLSKKKLVYAWDFVLNTFQIGVSRRVGMWFQTHFDSSLLLGSISIHVGCAFIRKLVEDNYVVGMRLLV